MTAEEAAAVLALFEQADSYDLVTWKVDMTAGPAAVRLFAICSDVFHYACADAEEITAADLPLLSSCLADLQQAGNETFYMGELFAARKRKMRPIAQAMTDMAGPVRRLFEACSTAEQRAEADRQDEMLWSGVVRRPGPA
jgi:hypothetical protein